jgi:hypothetical protein
VAITSEQIWDVPALEAPATGDTYVLGRPARSSVNEPSHLRHDVDWNGLVRSATAGFFEERERGCPIRPTLAKILGVIVALTGLALITLAVIAALGIWTIRAMLG